jgi:hypothetical protein
LPNCLRRYEFDYMPVVCKIDFYFIAKREEKCLLTAVAGSGWREAEAGLISPSGLVVAVVIVRQSAHVRTIHMHDEDFAGFGALF